MEKFREFQGKDLDEAIQRACSFFDCAREKLEIEILQDAKSGIFGIVGARKAKIRARKIQLRDAVESILGQNNFEAEKRNIAGDEKPEERELPPAAENSATPPAIVNEKALEKQKDVLEKAEAGVKREKEGKSAESSKNESVKNENSRKEKRESSPRHGRDARQEKKNAPRPEKRERVEPRHEDIDLEDGEDGLPARPLEDLDKARLADVVAEVVSRLIEPIAGRKVPVAVELGHGRVRARVDWQGDAGLLIGREGLTLVALQYLASRMVSRMMDAALRVQLDIGDYRRRQDDKLREMAKILADKAKHNGRSYSTRPLSSYHRRVIHLSLQDEKDVQTRSSGEGPLKRVVISPRSRS